MAEIERRLSVYLVGGILDRLQATSDHVSLLFRHFLVPVSGPAIEIDHLGVREAAKCSSLLRRDQVREGLTLELGFLCRGLDGGGRTLSVLVSLHPSEEPEGSKSIYNNKDMRNEHQNIGSTEDETFRRRGKATTG